MPRGRAWRLPWGKVRALWEEGRLSASEIGARYGCEGRVIRRAAKAFGWPDRGWQVHRPRRSDPLRMNEAEVLAMAAAGLPHGDIARANGVTRSAVRKFLHRRGLRRPQGWRPKGRLEDWPQLRLLAAGFAVVAARETRLERAGRTGGRRAA